MWILRSKAWAQTIHVQLAASPSHPPQSGVPVGSMFVNTCTSALETRIHPQVRAHTHMSSRPFLSAPTSLDSTIHQGQEIKTWSLQEVSWPLLGG